MSGEFMASGDTTEQILLARAQALAQIEQNEEAETSIEIVAFLLANESYGIETAYVREVSPLQELTRLPGTPPFVAGIINLRGEIVSVIDIKTFFGLPEKGLTDLNKVIVISNGLMEFGILADAIVDVKRIPIRHIQPPLATLTGIREDFLQGISANRLAILHAANLLNYPGIIVNEEVI